MFVKICGITNEEDALLAVAMGADALGFVFAPSPRQVAVNKVHEITRRLPPEILTVGVFRDDHPSRVIDVVATAGLKAAQLHGHETPDAVAEVSRHVRTVIKAFSAGSTDVRRADQFGTNLVLIDAASPGSGSVWDWSLADEVPEGVNVILAGGLDPTNVSAAIARVRPWGVDVSSGVERSPGRKDALKVKAFIEAARVALPDEPNADGSLGDVYDWMDE